MSYLATTARLSAVAMVFFIPLSNTLTTVSSILLAISILLSMEQEQLRNLIYHPITVAVLIIFSLYCLGALYSIGSSAEIQQALRKMSRLLYIPLLIPLFSMAKWRRYASLAFLAAVFISIVSNMYLGQVFFKDNIFTSLFVAYAIFVLAHYAVTYPKYRLLSALMICLFTYYLLFINIGRSGQLLLLVLYLLFSWQRYGAKFKYQVISILVFVSIIAASLILPSSFSARQALALQELNNYLQLGNAAADNSSTGTRLAFAANALELIKQRPVFGWGTGSFAQANAQNIPPTVNPHNQYLLTGVELGLVGICSLIYLFITLIKHFWGSKDLDAYLGTGLVLAIAIGCMANSWLLDFASMFFLVILTGIYAGCRKI